MVKHSRDGSDSPRYLDVITPIYRDGQHKTTMYLAYCPWLIIHQPAAVRTFDHPFGIAIPAGRLVNLAAARTPLRGEPLESELTGESFGLV
jgi:hypothetical protein